MSEVNYSQIGKIANNGDNKFSLQDAKGIKQSKNSVDLSNINWWGRVILKGGANAANRTACKIDRQFDPYTRGEYDRYLIQCAVKAWEESYKVLCSACTFSRWIGWAYLKFVIKLIGKFNELLKLSDPERALERGMPPKAFFTWKGIPCLEKKIDIENVDATYKLQLSYNPKDGLTANIIDSQNNETSVKIIAISSVKSDDTLFCLHTENGREILVNKTDLLTIGLNLKGKVPLKQFFVDNNVPSFEDRAIISNEGKLIKLSYDANSSSENDGISLYCVSDYTKVSIEPCLNGSVCLYGIRDGGNSPTFISLFQTENLHNFVNSLRTTENSNSSEQEGDPINQFFRKQNAVPFKGDGFWLSIIQNDDTPQFDFISVSSYGNNCVNLVIVNSVMPDRSWQRFFTQNVRIKDYSQSNAVGISGQYWDTGEKRWKNFDIMVNRVQLLQCKHGDKTMPNRPATIELTNFLLRNDALPPEDQTRTLTATQLDGPNSEKNNQEVQIEINSSGDVHVGDDTLKDPHLFRNESCNDNEAIIRGDDWNWGRMSYFEYKINLDDLLGKGDNK